MNADERRCFLERADAVATAAAVKSGKVTATEAVSAALERIAVKDKASGGDNEAKVVVL